MLTPRQLAIILFFVVVVMSAAMAILFVMPRAAGASSTSLSTNCYDGVQSVAANSNHVFYVCKDRGDHDVHILTLY